MKQKKLTDEQIREGFEKHKHLGKMAVEFGVPDVTIFRRCKKLGLDFSTGGFIPKIELSEILEGKHPSYQTRKLKNRILAEKILENKCSECGITDWNNKPLVLHLDHIDGNGHNHLLTNLRMLCPNCHTQTETWCGKNKIF